jgi:peptidyl-tRNA hydrolase, PTH1 family
MKIIVGLGNPGKQYEKTRHNLGFLVLDFLQGIYDFPCFNKDTKLRAEVSLAHISGEKVLLVKPQTFMNLSGESLILIKNFYKLSEEDFIILYDDKDMTFGKIRMRKEGSAGGHNGIKSIIQYFGSTFLRIKVGIADEEKMSYQDTSSFVLDNFSKDSLQDISESVAPQVQKMIEELL